MLQILQTIGVFEWVMFDALVVFGPIILLIRFVYHEAGKQQRPRLGYGASPYANRWAYENGYGDGFKDGAQSTQWDNAPFGFDSWDEFLMAEDTRQD